MNEVFIWKTDIFIIQKWFKIKFIQWNIEHFKKFGLVQIQMIKYPVFKAIHKFHTIIWQHSKIFFITMKYNIFKHNYIKTVFFCFFNWNFKHLWAWKIITIKKWYIFDLWIFKSMISAISLTPPVCFIELFWLVSYF